MAAPAVAGVTAGGDVSLGGTLVSNPYLEVNSSATVSATAEVSPWIRLRDDQSLLELRGDVLVNLYAQNYGDEITPSVRLNGNRQLSPYVGISGGLGYRSSRGGLHYNLVTQNGPADTQQPITTPLPDVTFAGNRTRNELIDGSFGLNWRISPFDHLGVSFNAQRSTYDAAIASDYNFFNGALTYGRTLSDRTTLTASVFVGRSDYSNTNTGDGTTVSPQVGIQQRLSPTWTLDVSAGATFVRTNLADGSIRKFTTFAGQAALCKRQSRSNFCLNAAQSAQPTAIGGIRSATNVSLNYENQLSLRNSLSASLVWSRDGDAQQAGIIGGSSTFYGASATLARHFNRRLSAFFSPSYSRYSNVVSPRSNIQVSIGIRYSFGAIS
jgi:hypothetical protein